MKNEFEVVNEDNIAAFLDKKNEIFERNYKPNEINHLKSIITHYFENHSTQISRGLANYWLRRLDYLVIRDDAGEPIFGEASMSKLLPQIENVLQSMASEAQLRKVIKMSSNDKIKKDANCPKPWSCDRKSKKKALSRTQ